VRVRDDLKINPAQFKYQYLPDYAKFLLENKLDEFTLVGIRFCREVDLPMMRPLAKLSEQELINLSRQGNQEILGALAKNDVARVIEKNIKTFLDNEIKDSSGRRLMDNRELVAEDIILAFYVRRKLFSFFLQSYTQNAVIHTLIITEVDSYSTQEQLLTSKALILTQKQGDVKIRVEKKDGV
jgi:hypothetical protein